MLQTWKHHFLHKDHPKLIRRVAIYAYFSSYVLGNIGNASAAAPEQKPREGKATKSFLDEDVYGPKDMDRWADIKEYDDDHDSDWFEEENKRLGKDFLFLIYIMSPFKKNALQMLCMRYILAGLPQA